jgi:mRNA interferase HigB
MRVIKKDPLLNFASKHPNLKSAIESLVVVIEKADWQTPEQVVAAFGQAKTDTFANERVCVNIGGGKCRVVIKVRYGWKRVYVKWMGLHKDYDKLKIKIEDLQQVITTTFNYGTAQNIFRS